MNRGRPFEPGNKLSRGRPRGSRNKRTLILQQRLDESSLALVDKSIDLALQGNVSLLRMLVGGTLSRLSDSAVKIGRVPMNTLAELSQAHSAILNKLLAGEITPAEALQLSALLDSQRRFIESKELETRLRAIEQLLLPPK